MARSVTRRAQVAERAKTVFRELINTLAGDVRMQDLRAVKVLCRGSCGRVAGAMNGAQSVESRVHAGVVERVEKQFAPSSRGAGAKSARTYMLSRC